ncbi:hypothetical protein T03_12418 [Trichinella britovi]|uniref:Uncharacterized protein n=1 Tax=Trichinella britovi TaxID=45882 RepID=A0A0V1C507_TRIBR|nr:hypothetical protein T03_12418 [Trichinella britovi]
MEGKFPHPSLDVEVEVRSMGGEEKTEEAMPRGKFKKYLPSGYASGYASGNIFAMPQGKFKKIFALWLCFRLRLRQYFRYASGKFKKYLPSGYASGYASGNFFQNFQIDSPRQRPKLHFRLRP